MEEQKELYENKKEREIARQDIFNTIEELRQKIKEANNIQDGILDTLETFFDKAFELDWNITGLVLRKENKPEKKPPERKPRKKKNDVKE